MLTPGAGDAEGAADVADDGVADLALAYAELQSMLLDGPDLADFLRQVAVLAVAVVPASSCGITMRRDSEVATIATSDELAAQVDELQYGSDIGPCLQALRTGVTIRVDDFAADPRWGDYFQRAMARGVRSSVSVPLVVKGETLGVINLYARRPHSFGPLESRRAEAFARQAAITLTLTLRSFDRTVVEGQLRAALAARAVIDQALGVMMERRHIGSRQAFAMLRDESQTRNVALREVAAELVESVTGHPPDPPRPFVERR